MTPTEARRFMKESFGPARARAVITKLADQVEALTKERDEYAKASDTMAMVHKVARDTLNARMDVLEAAAKLALDALDEAQTYADNVGKALDEAQKYAYNVGKYMHGVPQAIETLKQAGVQ